MSARGLPQIGDGMVTGSETHSSRVNADTVTLRAASTGIDLEASHIFDRSPGKVKRHVYDENRVELCPYEGALKEIYLAACRDTGEIPSEDGITRFRNKKQSLFGSTAFCLRNQNLNFNSGVVIARVLSNVQSLSKVDLYGNVLRDGGVLAIVQLLRANSNIRHLNLGSNDIGTEGGNALAAFLRNNETLEILELGSEASSIHPNRFRSSVVQAFCKVLKHENNFLRKLDFTRVTVDDSIELSCNYIKNMIIVNSALICIKLGANHIGSSAGKEILESFLKNRAISELDLSNNRLDSKVSMTIENVMKYNSTLETINLNFNALGRSFATAASESLAMNKTLLRLELEGNRIGDEGAFSLARSLSQSSCTVTYLNVANNAVDCYAALECARLLSTCDCPLVVLKLSSNKLGDSCASAFASALEVNANLRRLEMNACHIGDKGAIRLSQALRVNHGLRALKLNNNYISDEAGLYLLENIAHNTSLCVLELKGNRVEVGILEKLKKLCYRNITSKKMEEPKKLLNEINKLKGVELELKEVEVAIRQEKAKTEMEASRKQQHMSDLAMLMEEEKLTFTRIHMDHDDEKEKFRIANEQKAQKLATLTNVKREYEERVRRLTEMINAESSTIASLDSQLDTLQEKQDRVEKEHARKLRDLKLTISSAIQTRDAAIAKTQAMEKEIAELEAHVGRTTELPTTLDKGRKKTGTHIDKDTKVARKKKAK